MENGNQPLILRCGQCKKPFDKEASLKRHGYYCRSRRGEKRTGLPRSCAPCAKAKVRCDKIAPKCSKCVTKNIDCRYPSNSTRSHESRTQQTRLENGARTAPSLVSNFSQINTLEIPPCTFELCSELVDNVTSIPALPDSGNETYAWDLPNIGSMDYSNDVQITPPTDFNALSTPTRVDATTLQNFVTEVQLMTYASTNTQIPRSLAFNPRSLRARPKLKNEAQVTASHMARILNSYPKMILNHDTLPPFIHPQWISASVSETFLEPLANCMGLLGILSAGARGTASLFWRNIRMECDRLSSTRHTLSKDGILAAIQALLVYMLIRLAEGETEHNNHDAALLGTITMMLKEIMTRFDYQIPELVHQEKSWSSWIFEESRHRMAILLRIVNMLVYMEPVTACDIHPGLLLAPLPARKQLWEAGSEEQWMNEVRRTTVVKSGFGLAINGDLVTMDEYQIKLLSMQSVEPWTSSRSKENWEEWCAGMDGLGTLIMLASSLTT